MTQELIAVDFAADSASATPYGSRYVVRKAPLVFKSGEYPDKNFTMSKDELRLAVADFKQPVPLKIEHRDSVLDGKLGEFIRAEYQDGETEACMSGKLLLPRWLHDLYPDQPIPLSASWDRATKRLAHVALVTKPRVEGAAVGPDIEAGFADFAKKAAVDGYVTQHGQMALQNIHDITAHHGSLCKTPCEVEKTGNGENVASSKDKDERGSGKTRTEMSLDDPADFAALCQAMFMHGSERDALQVIHDCASKVGARCSFQQVKPGEVGKPLVTGTPGMATSTSTSGERGYHFSAEDETSPAVAALKKQLADQKAATEVLRKEKIKNEAVAFSKEVLGEHRVHPHEIQGIIDNYLMAAEADNALGGTVDFNGAQTSRLAAYTGSIKARVPHQLTKELLSGKTDVQVLLNQTTAPKNGEAQMSKERRAELLAQTPLGALTLADETK